MSPESAGPAGGVQGQKSSGPGCPPGGARRGNPVTCDGAWPHFSRLRRDVRSTAGPAKDAMAFSSKAREASLLGAKPNTPPRGLPKRTVRNNFPDSLRGSGILSGMEEAGRRQLLDRGRDEAGDFGESPVKR